MIVLLAPHVQRCSLSRADCKTSVSGKSSFNEARLAEQQNLRAELPDGNSMQRATATTLENNEWTQAAQDAQY